MPRDLMQKATEYRSDMMESPESVRRFMKRQANKCERRNARNVIAEAVEEMELAFFDAIVPCDDDDAEYCGNCGKLANSVEAVDFLYHYGQCESCEDRSRSRQMYEEYDDFDPWDGTASPCAIHPPRPRLIIPLDPERG